MAQDGSLTAKDFSNGALKKCPGIEKHPAGAMILAFDGYVESNSFKESGVVWLLLGCIDTLQRENRKLSMVNRWLNTLESYKKPLFSFRGRADRGDVFRLQSQDSKD